jgi:hypothetical protein
MLRRTALVLILALTAVSARQLTCVWECTDAAADAGTTACHGTGADGPVLAAQSAHCPLAADAVIFTMSKGGEPHRQRHAASSEPVASIVPSIGYAAAISTGPWSLPPAPPPLSRTFSVLRI